MIRWTRYAGDKRHLSDDFNKAISKDKCDVYVEPFFGSGSVFFNLKKDFKKYILNDKDAIKHGYHRHICMNTFFISSPYLDADSFSNILRRHLHSLPNPPILRSSIGTSPSTSTSVRRKHRRQQWPRSMGRAGRTGESFGRRRPWYCGTLQLAVLNRFACEIGSALNVLKLYIIEKLCLHT